MVWLVAFLAALYLVLFTELDLPGILCFLAVPAAAWLLLRMAFRSRGLEDADVPYQGSARLAKRDDLAKRGTLAERSLPADDGVILTRLCEGVRPGIRHAVKSTDIVRLCGEGHTLVIAPPGTGKSTGIIIPNALHYSGSIFVADIKGEIVAATAAWRRRMGQRVFVLDPFRLTDETSSGINAMAFISTETLQEDCKSLAASLLPLPPRSGQSGDDYWKTAGRDLLTCLIGFCVTTQEKPTLLLIRKWLRLRRNDLVELLAQVCQSEHMFISGGANTFIDMPEKQFAGVLSTAITATDFLDNPRLAEALASGECDLSVMKREPTSVYLVIPDEMIEAQPGFVRLISEGLLTLLKRDRQKGLPVLLLLDEFANCGYMEKVEKNLTLVRGYGVRIVMIAQSVGQLKALYGENSFHNMRACCTAQVYSCGSDLVTLMELSGFLGDRTVQERKSPGLLQYAGENWAKSINNPFMPLVQGSMKILVMALFFPIYLPMMLLGWLGEKANPKPVGSPIKRPLMTHDELASWGVEHQITIIQGLPPIMGQRIKYFADPEFANRYGAAASREAASP